MQIFMYFCKYCLLSYWYTYAFFIYCNCLLSVYPVIITLISCICFSDTKVFSALLQNFKAFRQRRVFNILWRYFIFSLKDFFVDVLADRCIIVSYCTVYVYIRIYIATGTQEMRCVYQQYSFVWLDIWPTDV